MEQNNNTRRVISLLVDNINDVLARISSRFCRRGFNIDSLTDRKSTRLNSSHNA